MLTGPVHADRWDGKYDSLDRQHGPWSRFSDDDGLLEFTIFRHGVKTGNSIQYSSAGNELSMVFYRDNVLHGEYYSNHDGEGEILHEEGQYKNGLKTGGWKVYFTNGQL